MFTDLRRKKINIFKRAAVAYMCAIGIPVVVLIFSFAQGGGWKPVIVGFPVYITIFGSITYQFIKELLVLKQEERTGVSEKNGKQ
ncbi:unnamed protein product [Mycetohabitans rhizoxinica HKI 454]|uniref:Uncharacterized protein n=1 Tax=Mycetohabitans rhizoxinica (strain DSM 19002 / CIP 109453 / HKI 454) TaxID=882378 RepID=E5ARN3_MYCRK|nr:MULTISPECIES: hypothetical protein [Mycetohabitans]MCG1047301.1 hypothetical protein [Mycetohabitans sp. B6]CBW75265.1 unnamed protein product [Mycetohabitans rhizoxinica HKI 454]